jgi:hypothetical protein
MPTPLFANPQFRGWIAVALAVGGLPYLLSLILASSLYGGAK